MRLIHWEPGLDMIKDLRNLSYYPGFTCSLTGSGNEYQSAFKFSCNGVSAESILNSSPAGVIYTSTFIFGGLPLAPLAKDRKSGSCGCSISNPIVGTY